MAADVSTRDDEQNNLWWMLEGVCNSTNPSIMMVGNFNAIYSYGG